MRQRPPISIHQQPSTPVGQNSGLTRLADRWWVALPTLLRHHSLFFSEAWADGLYLTARPLLALLLPLLALLLGLLEGCTHWSFLIDTNVSYGGIAITFTELLLFMMVTALLGALSANLGLMIVLGYALGDFIVFGLQLTNNQLLVAPSGDILLSLTYPRVPQLVSYAILFMLAVVPTISTKYLTLRVTSLLKVKEPFATILQTVVMALVQGLIVYVWTLAAPLLIRVFWGWTNSSPPLAAAYYLQQMGSQVVVAALVGIVLRGWLSYQASRAPIVTSRTASLTNAFRAADTHPAFLRRLPPIIRSLLAAFGLTLLVSGFIASLVEGFLFFLFLALVFIARTDLLPRSRLWVRWSALIGRIPLLARLIGGALLAYYITQAFLTAYIQFMPQEVSPTPSATLRPVLFTMCLSLLIMTFLLPRLSPIRPPAPTQPLATRPF